MDIWLDIEKSLLYKNEKKKHFNLFINIILKIFPGNIYYKGVHRTNIDSVIEKSILKQILVLVEYYH
jgi:hypothetical protein